MARKKKLTKSELRATLPEKLNKLGEWYFSDDKDKLYAEIKDMRAVLKVGSINYHRKIDM